MHLNVGLNKIRETVDQVEELQASLSVKKIELEQKNQLANQKLKQMVSGWGCYLCCDIKLVILCRLLINKKLKRRKELPKRYKRIYR